MAISLNHHENKVATTIQKLTNRIGNASMDVVFDEFPKLKTELDKFTTRYRSGFSDIPKTWSDIHELHSSSLGKTNYSYSEIRMHDLYNVQSSDLMKFENDTSLILMGKDCVLREYMPTDYLKSNVDPNFDMSTVRIFGINSPSKAIVYSNSNGNGNGNSNSNSNSNRNSNGTENSSSVKEGDMLLYLLDTKTNDVTHLVVPQEMIAQFLNVAPINEELLKKEQESRMSSPGHESEKVVAEKYFKAKHEEQIEYRKNFTEEKQPLELVKKTLVKNWIEHLNDFYTKATESKAEAEKAKVGIIIEKVRQEQGRPSNNVEFSQIKDELKGKHVVVFGGFSGLEYQNPKDLAEKINNELKLINEKYKAQGIEVVVVAGATPEGIGMVYDIAKEMGLKTYGIVSNAALEYSENPASVNCDKVFYSEQPKGVWDVKDANGSSYMVEVAKLGVSGEARYYGGGEVAVNEVKEFKDKGILTHIDVSDVTKPNEANVAKKASKSADPLKFVAEPLKEFMEARKKELKLKGVSKTTTEDIRKNIQNLREKTGTKPSSPKPSPNRP